MTKQGRASVSIFLGDKEWFIAACHAEHVPYLTRSWVIAEACHAGSNSKQSFETLNQFFRVTFWSLVLFYSSVMKGYKSWMDFKIET